jgi:hypothetical protein
MLVGVVVCVRTAASVVKATYQQQQQQEQQLIDEQLPRMV